jgi:aspartyl-tRNA(Asn)/glutamyl-tRNA(Gln) amidotransferase subunit C
MENHYEEMMIEPEMFTHLVELASFEFEADQADYLREQLNRQLKTIEELAAVPLDDSLPTEIHGVRYPAENRQPLRPDKSSEFKDSDLLTTQFPRFEDGYVIVPVIPHQELD